MSVRPKRSVSKGLPKNKIVKSRSQIKEILKNGSKKSGELLTIYELHEPKVKETKFAFLCDRSSSRATERNRLKRIVREIVRNEGERLPKGAVIFLVKPAGENKTYWQIREELLELISK